MTTWCELLTLDYERRKAGLPFQGMRARTDADIDAAYHAAFKPQDEWACGDILEIVTGDKERESGVATGPVIKGRVMVLFEDGVHWSYEADRCHVRRADQ